MPIRMTGMMSGLDTDAIIKELMTAQSAKKTKVENKKTKLEWSQTIWKDMNTKLYGFTTGSVFKLRKEGSYLNKKVSSSNESKVTAKATISAPQGAHKLQVNSLAQAQSLTSGVIKTADGGKPKAQTTLADIGITVGTVINIKSNSSEEKAQKLEVTDQTSISDFVAACKAAGVNANFDESQSRLFISSAASGKENAFSITTDAAGYTDAKNKIGDLIGYSQLTNDEKKDVQKAYQVFHDDTSTQPDKDAAKAALEKYMTKTMAYNQAMEEEKASIRSGINTDDIKDELYTTAAKAALKEAGVADDDPDYATKLADKAKEMKDSDAAGNSFHVTPDALEKAVTAQVDKLYAEDSSHAANVSDNTQKYIDDTSLITGYAAKQTDLANAVAAFEAQDPALADGTASELTKLGIGEITGNETTDVGNTGAGGAVDDSKYSLVVASDANITLDGANMTFTTNNITVNNISLELKGVTEANEEIKIVVENDTDTTYNMVKDFVKEYNTALKSLNDAYYADSARGYEPLTSEEKEAMSDDEVEKWETKIKDSLLRRDNTVFNIASAMRSAMQISVTASDGKTYSLASLGITTSSDYTEKGLLHIHGDADDDTYSDEEDNKLQKMLNTNPELVQEILTKVGDKLYSSMQEKMQKTSLSSALTFYNDLQMTQQLDNYKKDIKNWETKLTDLENRYYKQFTAMETAMAKLNSQSNYLSSLLGTSA